MPTIKPKSHVRIASSESGAVISQEISGSQHYLGFVVHVSGYQSGLSCNIQGKLDGTNWVDLDPLTFNLATPAFITGAACIFQFELNAPIRGGLRIVSTSNNDGTAGVITVSMFKSAYSRGTSDYA